MPRLVATVPPVVIFPEIVSVVPDARLRFSVLASALVRAPESVRLPAVMVIVCAAVELPKMIGAEMMLFPAVLTIAALVVVPLPRSVRAVVAFAEERVKLPVAKVMAPVVAFAVRLGLVVLLARLNVARLVALPPGATVPFQFVPVLHVVLLDDVQVAF